MPIKLWRVALCVNAMALLLLTFVLPGCKLNAPTTTRDAGKHGTPTATAPLYPTLRPTGPAPRHVVER